MEKVKDPPVFLFWVAKDVYNRKLWKRDEGVAQVWSWTRDFFS